MRRKIKLVVKIFFFFVVIFLVLSTGTFADKGSFDNTPHKGKLGVGIVVPAGITLKYWTNPTNSLDLKVGWGSNDDRSRFCFDYLWHNFNFLKESENLALYYGIGGKFQFSKDKDRVGLRIVGGINYLFEKFPFDFFMELSPTLLLSPETTLEADAAVGIRYFFQ